MPNLSIVVSIGVKRYICIVGRLIAIDYGTKRTGLAWTDPFKMIATGIGSFAANTLYDKLDELVSQGEIEGFVVGWPTRGDGSDTHNTENVRQFVKWLESKFPKLEIILWDERFTSRQAQQVMLQAGVKKKKRREKQLINQISATIILQDYLSTIS